MDSRKTMAFVLTAALAAGMLSGAAIADGHDEADPGLFLVGAAAVSADPEEPFDDICLGGYGSFCTRPMTEIRDPLLTRAIAITGDAGAGETFVLVSTIAVGLFATHKDSPESRGYSATGAYDMRTAIAERTRLPIGNIVVSSDHSHSAPDTVGLWGGVTPEYMEVLLRSAVEAGVQAYENRELATLAVAGVTETDEPVTPADDEEWRVLAADAPDGRRVATLINFSSHATVLGSNNRGGASGDWIAWAPEIAEARYGGTGVAAIGAIGAHTSGWGSAQGWDGGWDKSGDPDEREAKARARIETFYDLVDDALTPITDPTVAVDVRFIREQVGQPILAALVGVPMIPGGPVQDGSVSIERSVLPPWLTGTVLGTYSGSARVGDVLFPLIPGEVFGEVNTHLKANVEDARHSFFIGNANDYLGKMAGSLASYYDSLENGLLWLPGCPDRPVREALDRRTGCTDRWSLQVSPTIGIHTRCVVEETAVALGFSLREVDEQCSVLTALNPLPGGAD